jgi:hypothetical protein
MPKEINLNPLDLAKKYYPSFKDSPNIKKFLIPIQPEYHNQLFPDYRNRQMKLTEYSEINVVGNTI